MIGVILEKFYPDILQSDDLTQVKSDFQGENPSHEILVIKQAWILKMSGIRIFRIYFEKSPKIR